MLTIKSEIDATLFVASLSTYDLSILKTIVESEYAKRIELDRDKKLFLYGHLVQIWPNRVTELDIQEFRNKTFINLIKNVRDKYSMSLRDSKQLVESFYQIFIPKNALEISLNEITDKVRASLDNS